MPSADPPPPTDSPYRDAGARLPADETPEAHLGVVAIVLVALGALGLWFATTRYQEDRVSAAVGALPSAVQAEAYRHVHEELATVCAAEPQRLAQHCVEQAAFILEFPQCDAECQKLAGTFLHDDARK